MGAFVQVRCPRCETVLLDQVGMQGVVRIKCRTCKRRIWVGGAPGKTVIVQIDKTE